MKKHYLCHIEPKTLHHEKAIYPHHYASLGLDGLPT